MYRPIDRMDSGYYRAFQTLSEPDARQALLEAWSTPEQREYNRTTKQCPDCRGWGYKLIRRGRETIREQCGCPTCLGLGKIPKEEKSN